MERAWGFRREPARKGQPAGRIVLSVDDGEVDLLRHLLDQLVSLLEPEGADAHEPADPLAVMVGIGTATKEPDDPALARLLPDAYRDDPERSAEFRRYTELTLRERKSGQAVLAASTLGGSAASGLSEEETSAWLLALNDLRLTLGTRLGVSEDTDQMWARVAELSEEDPALVMYQVYDWLSGLQATLLQAVSA